MFKDTNNNANSNTTNKMKKATAIFNARNALSTAAHKMANVSFAAATAGGTVVASTCYYTANTKHISRNQKRQIGKTNNVACGIAIAGTAVGTVAKLVEGIAQPMPFNRDKYLDDTDEDIEAEVAKAEEAVESHIEPKEETKEGAEKNAQ